MEHWNYFLVDLHDPTVESCGYGSHSCSACEVLGVALGALVDVGLDMMISLLLWVAMRNGLRIFKTSRLRVSFGSDQELFTSMK